MAKEDEEGKLEIETKKCGRIGHCRRKFSGCCFRINCGGGGQRRKGWEPNKKSASQNIRSCDYHASCSWWCQMEKRRLHGLWLRQHFSTTTTSNRGGGTKNNIPFLLPRPTLLGSGCARPESNLQTDRMEQSSTDAGKAPSWHSRLLRIAFAA